MKTELFDYELPEQLIAQHPPPERDGGRLLVLGRAGLEQRAVADLPELVPAGSLLVVNDSRVIKARLIGHKRATGGRTEIFLLRPLGGDDRRQRFTALGRASKTLAAGTRIDAGSLEVTVLAKHADGELTVELAAETSIEQALAESGHVPLPPYVRRSDEPEDAVRYQTIYAAHDGSVAAPTAGLHLSEALLARLAERGVELARATLHVGLGTFRPVTTDDLDEHPMHSEELVVSPELAQAVERARGRGAPVVAVGTTVVRALESASDPERPGHVLPRAGETDLLIQPGHRFAVVDALLTNFHMPKSTLLALVAAFAGRERVLDAYREAVRARYRFLSYGDAMWIPERSA